VFQVLMAGGLKGNEAVKALYDLGQMYQEKLNDYPHAIEVYMKIIRDFPNFLSIDKVHFHLATCYEKDTKPEDALRTYREIVEKHPYSSFLPVAQQKVKSLGLKAGQVGSVIETQENIVENAKTDTQAAKASLELAGMHLKQGDFKKASQEYRKVAIDAPDAATAKEAYQNLASVLEDKEKDYKGAAAALEELISKYPNESGMEKNMYRLGRIYEQNLQDLKVRVRGDQVLYRRDDENTRKAIDYYNRLTESSPDADISADAFLRKGELFEERLKEPEEAKKQYQEFLKKFPDHPDAEKVKEKIKKLEE